jgi:hypothetical protein
MRTTNDQRPTTNDQRPATSDYCLPATAIRLEPARGAAPDRMHAVHLRAAALAQRFDLSGRRRGEGRLQRSDGARPPSRARRFRGELRVRHAGNYVMGRMRTYGCGSSRKPTVERALLASSTLLQNRHYVLIAIALVRCVLTCCAVSLHSACHEHQAQEACIGNRR